MIEIEKTYLTFLILTRMLNIKVDMRPFFPSVSFRENFKFDIHNDIANFFLEISNPLKIL